MNTCRQPTTAIVAEHARVPVTTVSRYLSGLPVSYVAKRRITRAIKKLKSGRSSTGPNFSQELRGRIGVVVDTSLDPWFVQLLGGIEEELSTRRSSMMLASLQLGPGYDANIVLRWIREKRVDGIIVAKSQARERALLQAAVQSEVPVVTIAPDEAVDQIENVQIVCCDNVAAGATVADFLTDLGHRRIGFAGGPCHSDSDKRLRGLAERLRELGAPLDTRFIYQCDRWDAEAGVEFGGTLFSKPLEITALVAANDALALGLMRAAQQAKIQIPGMLSVVGFDNVPEGALAWPGLTTVAQPMREMGRAACNKLFEAMTGPLPPKSVDYSMKLMVRESTGPVPNMSGQAQNRC